MHASSEPFAKCYCNVSGSVPVNLKGTRWHHPLNELNWAPKIPRKDDDFADTSSVGDGLRKLAFPC